MTAHTRIIGSHFHPSPHSEVTMLTVPLTLHGPLFLRFTTSFDYSAHVMVNHGGVRLFMWPYPFAFNFPPCLCSVSPHAPSLQTTQLRQAFSPCPSLSHVLQTILFPAILPYGLAFTLSLPHRQLSSILLSNKQVIIS